MKTENIILSLGILTIAFTIITSYLEKKASTSHQKKWVQGFLILIGILTIATSFLQSYKDDLDEEKSKNYQDTIRNLTSKIKNNSDSLLFKQNIQINRQLNELKLSNKIISNQFKSFQNDLDLLGYTTGGKGNKPVLFISLQPEVKGRYKFKCCLRNMGKYPIRDVNLRLIDYYSTQTAILDSKGKTHLKDVDTSWKLPEEEFIKNTSFGAIEPGGAYCDYEGYVLAGIDTLRFDGDVKWHNGTYGFQYILVYDHKQRSYVIHDVSYWYHGMQVDQHDFFPLVPKEFYVPKGVAPVAR